MEENLNHTSQNEDSQNTQQDYQYSYGNGQYQSYNSYQPDNHQNEDTSVLSMGDWLLTVLALLIPCVGIILYFVWAFGKNGNVNRRNYCRAYLIYWAITAVLSTVVAVFLVGVLQSTGGYYY